MAKVAQKRSNKNESTNKVMCLLRRERLTTKDWKNIKNNLVAFKILISLIKTNILHFFFSGEF